MSHITRERESLKHDDRLDALSGAVTYMMEWLSDDEDRGLEYHAEKEAEKSLEYSLQFAAMMGSTKKKTHLNYAQNF